MDSQASGNEDSSFRGTWESIRSKRPLRSSVERTKSGPAGRYAFNSLAAAS
jgi:hypothetical protein